jgi:hypothetical protein
LILYSLVVRLTFFDPMAQNKIGGLSMIPKDKLQENKAISQKDFKEKEASEVTYTPLQNQRKTALNYNKISAKIIERLQKKEFVELRQDLLQYDHQTQSEFLAKKGAFLLNWALATNTDSKALAFLCENIPHSILQKTLSGDNYYPLESFLLAEKALEKHGFPIDTEVQIEKFKILLELDKSGVSKFIDDANLTDKIKNSFQIAVQQHNSLSSKKAKTSSSASGSNDTTDAVAEEREGNNATTKHDLEASAAATIGNHNKMTAASSVASSSTASSSSATPILHSSQHTGKRKFEKIAEVQPSTSNDTSNSTAHTPPSPKSK